METEEEPLGKYWMSPDKEKTILITGTSRGIGFDLAKLYLELGYRVCGISRTPTSFNEARFEQIQADLGNPEEILSLSKLIAGKSIFGLINNAAILGPTGPFENNDLGRWAHAFQVNLFSAATLSQICIPSLKREHGFVIFLSGGGSAFPRPNFSAYGISKTAVVRLSEVLARELYPDVMVYCVAPGPNRTRLLEEAIQGGEIVPEDDIVDFSYVERLCLFLTHNKDPRYSGKFIHVKDQYDSWGEQQLTGDGYTLRRIKS